MVGQDLNRIGFTWMKREESFQTAGRACGIVLWMGELGDPEN